MHAQEVLTKLRALAMDLDQSQLVEGLSSWPLQEACTLLQVLQDFPPGFLHKQREALHRASLVSGTLQPYSDYALYSNVVLEQEPVEKVACVILAGGQGTRLAWHGPKALFPLLPEESKTLLHIHLENLRSTAPHVPIAIMCSPLNVCAIRSAVQDIQGVEVFVQDLLPLLDHEENWFLEAGGKLSQGPDGNGRVFYYLHRAGILSRWQEYGIEHIAVAPIDNPLARPLDPVFLSYHRKCGSDVTTACVLREDTDEKVGTLSMLGDRPCVVEYTEMDSIQKEARHADGSLVYSLANINIFLFRLSFALQLIEKDFPWHLARKTARKFYPVQGIEKEITVTKLETFLFDALRMTTRVPALVYPREEIYAPLKNAQGDKSPETVRAALWKNRNKNSLLCYDRKGGKNS